MENLLIQYKTCTGHKKQIAYDSLLHYYKENESLYYRIMHKDEDEWSEGQREFMSRMEKIRDSLEL